MAHAVYHRADTRPTLFWAFSSLVIMILSRAPSAVSCSLFGTRPRARKVYRSGFAYRGQYRSGLRHGQGVMKWPDGPGGPHSMPPILRNVLSCIWNP